MATKYQAPKSQYNKDETFATLNVSEGHKVVITEGVAKENDEGMMIYAFVESAEKITNYGNDGWEFTPQLCKIKLLKVKNEYNGKTYEPTPGMLVAIHAIQTMEGKPFKGWLDFSKNQWDADLIIKGEVDGVKQEPVLIEALKKSAYLLEPTELSKLKDITIEELKSYGQGKGKSYGQTEGQRLADRLAFLKAQAEVESDLKMVLRACGVQDTATQNGILLALVENLFK